jgi:hypothetical protein
MGMMEHVFVTIESTEITKQILVIRTLITVKKVARPLPNDNIFITIKLG